jgi:hypothetical protein
MGLLLYFNCSKMAENQLKPLTAVNFIQIVQKAQYVHPLWITNQMKIFNPQSKTKTH